MAWSVISRSECEAWRDECQSFNLFKEARERLTAEFPDMKMKLLRFGMINPLFGHVEARVIREATVTTVMQGDHPEKLFFRVRNGQFEICEIRCGNYTFPYKYTFLADPYFICCNSIQVALFCAFRLQRSPLPNSTRHMMRLENLTPYLQFHYAKSGELEVIPDTKYNKIIGVESKTLKVEYDFPKTFVPEPSAVDLELYQIFRGIVTKQMRDDRGSGGIGVTMGNTRVSVEMYDFYTQVVRGFKEKNSFSARTWLEITGNQFYPIVSCIPKPGTFTNNGRTRTVFAMTTTYEAALRLYLRGLRYHTLEGYVPDQRKVGLKHQYSYDVKSCDTTVAQYWYKLVQEEWPELFEVLYPKVVTPHGLTRPDKLPSGVVHTAFVVNCFTKAICVWLEDTYGCDYRFQGDGILTDRIVFHRYLRRNPDYTFNGFKCGLFNNTHKIAAPAYIRGPKYLRGAERYFVRYLCYRALRAVGLDKYPKPTSQFCGMSIDEATPAEVMRIIQMRNGVIPRLLHLASGSFVYSGVNNCATEVFNPEHLQEKERNYTSCRHTFTSFEF